MYLSISSKTDAFPATCKFPNISALIYPFIAFIVALFIEGPTLDMERVIPYIGRSSLKFFNPYTEP